MSKQVQEKQSGEEQRKVKQGKVKQSKTNQNHWESCNVTYRPKKPHPTPSPDEQQQRDPPGGSPNSGG